MTGLTDDDVYDSRDNASKCYALALRQIRLEKIRSGLYRPNENDPEEMAAAPVIQNQAGLPTSHRVVT